MTTTTIRVTVQTRDHLQSLAQAAGVPMQRIIDRALELYHRQQMLQAMNEAYARLRADEAAWKDWKTELAEWDVTLADGLPEE
jgi:hypothetical protein